VPAPLKHVTEEGSRRILVRSGGTQRSPHRYESPVRVAVFFESRFARGAISFFLASGVDEE